MSARRIQLGIAGLGVGAADMLPAIAASDDVEVRAAAVRNKAIRASFVERYPNATIHDSVEALSSDPRVEAIVVATPNRLHAEHVLTAVRAGKHVLVYRPMAFRVSDADLIIDTAERHSVSVIVGKSFGYTPAILGMRRIADSGRLGPVRAVTVRAYTDWMLTTRSEHDKDPRYGGVVWKSAADQIDVVRVVVGGTLSSVRASIGTWMRERPMPGFYCAYLEFADGTPALVSYDGHGYYVGSELVSDAARLDAGARERVALRRGLRDGTRGEEAEEASRRFGGAREAGQPSGVSRTAIGGDEDPGRVVVSCERGAMRLSRRGILVYDDEGRHEVVVEAGSAAGTGPAAYLEDLVSAVRGQGRLVHDAAWERSTIEVCEATVLSARERREVRLAAQSPIPSGYAAHLMLTEVSWQSPIGSGRRGRSR